MTDTPPNPIYQPDAEAPAVGDMIDCRVIGVIRTPYEKLEDCPNRHNKRDYLTCTIELAAAEAPGIDGLKTGDRALVLYWLHLARRDMVQLPVREGVRDTPLGVFSTRTPPRPNPIAASVVEIVDVRDGALDVVGLDCLDRTPLLDIKRARFFDGDDGTRGLS